VHPANRTHEHSDCMGRVPASEGLGHNRCGGDASEIWMGQRNNMTIGQSSLCFILILVLPKVIDNDIR